MIKPLNESVNSWFQIDANAMIASDPILKYISVPFLILNMLFELSNVRHFVYIFHSSWYFIPIGYTIKDVLIIFVCRDSLIWKAIPTLIDAPNPPPVLTNKRPAPKVRTPPTVPAKKSRVMGEADNIGKDHTAWQH